MGATDGSDARIHERMAQAIDKILPEIRDRGYEENWHHMVRAYCDSCEICGCGANKRDESTLFCSELLALILQRGEVLGMERPSDEFVPEDFLSSDGKMVEKANMVKGFGLSPVLELRLDKLAWQ